MHSCDDGDPEHEAKENMRKRMAAAGMLALLAATPFAGAADTDPAVQTVEVKGTRTRLVAYRTPYYELARKVDTATRGRVVLAVQLVPARPGGRIDDVRLWLEADGEEPIAVGVDKAGRFVVPVLARMAERDARFSINKKKGELMANAFLQPAIGKDAWTIGAVRQLTAHARSAIGAVTPWYLKPFGSMRSGRHGVAVCASGPGAAVTIANGDGVVASLPLDTKTQDQMGQPVLCHMFGGDEAYDDSSKVVIPDEAQVMLL
jgi:hypothetical protein